MFTKDQWRAHVAKVLSPVQPLHRGASVLEVGAGCGAFMEEWKALDPLARVSGLDYSAASVEVAARRVGGTFVVGNVRAPQAIF